MTELKKKEKTKNKTAKNLQSGRTYAQTFKIVRI